MKIAILLPYKEDYTSKYSGAVSIHVSNLYKYSKYKNNIEIFGNTNFKSYLTKNFKNITIKENILSSSNKKYLNKFIEDQKKIFQILLKFIIDQIMLKQFIIIYIQKSYFIFIIIH